jgi:ubiquitin C-terminal hydrolase
MTLGPSFPEGIPNLGNTCWLSSLLQLLCSSPKIQALLDELPDRGHLTHGLKRLPSSVSLVYSMIQRKLIDGGQQDPCEGLLILLEQLHSEHSSSLSDPNTLDPAIRQLLRHSDDTYSAIHGLFQGAIEWIDSDNALRYEPFFTLFCDLGSLPVEPTPDHKISVRMLVKEALCRKKIVRFPPVMIFCIERNAKRVFTNDTYELCRDFTIRRANDFSIYLLKAVCLHSGGMSFGHYTSLRTDPSARWWMADDHNVTPLERFPETTRQVPRLMLFERL